MEYHVKNYERDTRTLRAPEKLRGVHPLGKSPVISHGDLVLAESGAIVGYLVEKYAEAGLAPPRVEERTRFLYWLHFAEGSAMPPLSQRLIFDRVETAPMPFFVRPVARMIARRVRAEVVDPRISDNLAFTEAELKRSLWFAGDAFSAADIQMSYPIEVSERRVGLQGHPLLVAFLERIRKRPAYQAALRHGGGLSVVG